MIDEKKLCKYILSELKNGNITKGTAIELVKQINYTDPQDSEVAVVGIGCRFREADDYESFWDLLINKNTAVDRCAKKRVYAMEKILPDGILGDIKGHSKGAYIDNLYDFDYQLFDFTHENATILAPGQRIMLEAAYRTLEDAGYLGERLKDNDTGVYIGNNFTPELLLSHASMIAQLGAGGFEAIMYNWSSGLATRITKQFDLKGPSYVVDLSCASSSVAIFNAYKAILDKQCDSALAGGINITLKPNIRVPGTDDWIFEHENDVVQRDYDDNTGGVYHGEAAAALFLKPLKKAIQDGDRIHAVFKGGSFNNNGSDGGFTGNSVAAIKDVLISAVKETNINIEDVGCFDGEGSSDKHEEMLQTSGLSEGIKILTNKRQFCTMGSISPNMGYLQAAIGVFCAIKGILALKHNSIPPLYHFIKPTSLLNFASTPFFVNDIPVEWKKQPGIKRCAGIYSFGYGGNNLVTFFQEAPEAEILEDIKEDELFILTAKSGYSFNKTIDSYIEFLEKKPESRFVDICYTASVGRAIYSNFRLAVIANGSEDLHLKLKAFRDGKILEKVYYQSNEEAGTKAVRPEPRFDALLLNRDFENIAAEFCKGSNMSFSKMYANKKVRICTLPNYIFDRKRCCVFDEYKKK
jgi:3-oxoacyl-[acyl-carrier-protein] synthase II